MGLSVGQIDLGLDVNSKSFNKQISGVASGAQKSVMSAFKPLGKMIGLALGGAAVVSFTKSCLKLGSDLSEVQNVVDTTFKTMNESVNDFAKNAMEEFGLSETVAKRYVGVLGTMSKSMGFSEKSAYDMATAVTGLAGDVASFYNLSSDEAYTKLKSIWTGETESLKDLGVMLTQTNLDQYALNNGFGKTTAKMTEQEKVMLRYQYTMSALGAAQGDFAKTSNSWANQTRVLSLRFDSLKATLGQGFINLFTPIIKLINNMMASLDGLAQKFVSFTELITGKSAAEVTGNTIESVVSEMTSSTNELSNATSDLGNTAADSAKKATQGLAGFDKLNNISESSSTSGASGSSGGLSLDTGLETPPDTSQYENSTTGLLDKLKTAFSGFKTWIDANFKPIWSNLVKEMRPRISTLRGILITAFDGVTDAWGVFVNFLGGSFTAALTSHFQFIGTLALTLFDCFNTVFSDIATLISPLVEVFQSNFIPYFDTMTNTTIVILYGLLDSFRIIFADIWNAVFPIVQSFVTLGLPVIIQFCTEAINSFGVLFNEIKAIFDMLWTDAVNPVLTQISNIWCDCMELVSEFWNKWGQPIFNAFNTMVEKMGSTLQNVWKEWIKPVWDEFMIVVDKLWSKHLKPLLSNFLDLVGEFINGAIKIYNEFIDPIVNWFVDILAPVIKNVIGQAIGVIESLLSGIIDTVNGIITSVKGIIEFITGVFTGDWKKAWQGVKDIFKGIFDSLVGIVKTPINLIIDVINGMIGAVVSGVNAVIRALNKLSFDVPDWIPGIGGKKFGFNLSEVTAPKIPKLAEGGYVKPNTPQLAMIGDNKHQGEIVAPEDKLRSITGEAVNNSRLTLLLAEQNALLKEQNRLLLAIENKESTISSKSVYEAVRHENKIYTKRTGHSGI